MVVLMPWMVPTMLVDVARRVLLPTLQTAYENDKVAVFYRDMVVVPGAFAAWAMVPAALTTVMVAKPFEKKLVACQDRMPTWGKAFVGVCLLARPHMVV
jgi:hypothetical protein